MASRPPPTRADYDRLKAQYDELRIHFETLREQVREQAKNAQIQFRRIAEIQAVLDEEARQDAGISARIHHAKPDGKAAKPDGKARA